MKIGVYYYPEQWPKEDWERDFDRIASMGLHIVHLAEFAWGTIEPKRDQFQFDWLDRSLELASKRNLDGILCTPTAVLPVWMVDEQPHVLDSDPNDDWAWETELQRNPEWRLQLMAEWAGRPVGFVQIIDPELEEIHYWCDVA